jgi:hypothetical protein
MSTGTVTTGFSERSNGARRRSEWKLFPPAGFFCVSANKMFDRFKGGGRANRGEGGERGLPGNIRNVAFAAIGFVLRMVSGKNCSAKAC